MKSGFRKDHAPLRDLECDGTSEARSHRALGPATVLDIRLGRSGRVLGLGICGGWSGAGAGSGMQHGGARSRSAAPYWRTARRPTSSPARSIRNTACRRARAWSSRASRCRRAAAPTGSASPTWSPAAPMCRKRTDATAPRDSASWYGDDFHGRLTANGEVFDMQSISAAHPTLPMPSYVRVTNLAQQPLADRARQRPRALSRQPRDRRLGARPRSCSASTTTASRGCGSNMSAARRSKAPTTASWWRPCGDGAAGAGAVAVMVASARPFAAAIRADAPLPAERPFDLGQPSAGAASSSARRSRDDRRRRCRRPRRRRPADRRADSRVAARTGCPPLGRRAGAPTSAYAAGRLCRVRSRDAGRGLY